MRTLTGLSLGSFLLLTLTGCGNAEIAIPPDNDGGTAAAGGSGGTGGTSGSGGAGGTTIPIEEGGTEDVADPCELTACPEHHHCVIEDGGAVCVADTCDDLECGPTGVCVDDGNGAYCEDISCTDDVDCDPEQYCNGTICVDDVCTPGDATCQGDALYVCESNGSGTGQLYMCGSPSYFTSECVEAGGVAACTCEDDWDCPAFTVCEVDQCVGTGTAPTCTLPAVPFVDIPPAVEIHWGGESQANSSAHDGTPAQNPAPWAAFAHALGTPTVANLDDDNGDGLINELDFPEILFITHQGDNPWANGVVRAIHGGGPNKGADYFARCGDKLWTASSPSADTCGGSEPDGDSGSLVTVADIDGDGVPEILYPTEGNGFRILDNTGALLLAPQVGWSPDDVGETLAVANLDFAGHAEVIVGRNVYMFADDTNGDLILTHVFTGDRALGRNGNSVMACPADMISTLPGQEIIAGTTMYRLPDTIPACTNPPCTESLEVVWHAPDVAGQNAVLTGGTADGFCAVADVWGADHENPPGNANPLDGTPEVVLIANGQLVILESATGTIIDMRNLQGGGRGGAPNIDDFDGDGFMEIASALQDFYIVVDLQPSTGTGGSCPEWPAVIARQVSATDNPNPPRDPGGTDPGHGCNNDGDCDADAFCNTSINTCVCYHNGWKRDSDDDSSRMTSSSVFDFNGDGAAEVVYNDECEFRVYDGTSGYVWYAEVSRSRTGIENPVVADVDNDGNAEVVTCMNTAVNNRCDDDPVVNGQRVPIGPNGIRVWGDPTDTWVSSRRIWNQQSYHVTNVTEGGGVPAHPPESWAELNGRVYNTYRSQPRSFGVAPDLTVSDVRVFSPNAQCGQLTDNIDIAVEVRNDGDLRVGPGVRIAFFGTWAGIEETLLDGSGGPLQIVLQNSLEPGASIILSVHYEPSYNGRTELPEQVRVMVDADDTERECNETNNDLTDVVEPGEVLPDLRLELGAAQEDCPAATVETTLYNDGSVPVSDVLIWYFAGDPSSGGTFLHEETVAGPIAGGGSETFTATIPNLPTNRDILVFGIADPQNAIEECNKANNKDSAEDTVRCNSTVR